MQQQIFISQVKGQNFSTFGIYHWDILYLGYITDSCQHEADTLWSNIPLICLQLLIVLTPEMKGDLLHYVSQDML